MFYRGNVQKRKLLKTRNHIKKKAAINQPEWDSTVQDLTVHAASPEELLRRRIRRKSKNVDIARREIMAKKRGIPVDLMLTPGQVELEMKKLAVLREVLYDHNDFNEVLKKTDQTMSSVKNIFHDSTARKSGRPNVTLAPGSKLPPPVHTEPEQPSRLDALSDSVMDSQALNDNHSSAEESENEDDTKFESKVDYERFLSLLKDSMNNTRNPTGLDTVTITPEKDEAAREKAQGALNCTEEVKRTLSRISSIKDAEEEAVAKNNQYRKIDQVISGLTKDASKLEKKLNNSLIPAISARPMPNHAPSNMTYDDLQGAMENVGRKLSAFEKRTGRVRDGKTSTAPCGLAGFTVTLIDSVTRLTTYVNEGEIRGQELEASVESLKCKLEHQVKVNEALALELVNTQKVIKQDQEETSSFKQALQQVMESKETTWAEEKEILERKVSDLVHVVTDLENKLIISEHSLVEEKTDSWNNLSDLQLVDAKFDKNIPTREEEKEKEEQALKNDMVQLLTALKTQNSKVAASQRTLPPTYSTAMTNATPESSKTIAAVESHLRHLQLQHAEAQQRMNELTHQAQMYPIPSVDDCFATDSMTTHPPTSYHNFTTDSMMSHPQQSHATFATESMMSHPQKFHGTRETQSMMYPPNKFHDTRETQSVMYQPRKSHATFAAESMMSHPQKSHGALATESMMSHPQKSHGALATESMMSHPQKSHGALAVESMMSHPQNSHGTRETQSMMHHPNNFHDTRATQSMMVHPKKFHPQKSHATFANEPMMSHPQKSHGALAAESMMSHPQKSHGALAAESMMSHPQKSHGALAAESIMSHPQKSHGARATQSMMHHPKTINDARATQSMMPQRRKSHGVSAIDPKKFVTSPIRRIPQRAIESQPSSINPSLGAAYYSSPPTQDEEEPTKESSTQGFSFDLESDPGSFKMLEEDTSETSAMQSTCSSGDGSAPEMAEQQKAVLNSIQQTQLSLEDRISELNKQHNQAQERLQKLVTRRKQEKAKKKVQMSLPSVDMLGTPQESHPFLPMPNAPCCCTKTDSSPSQCCAISAVSCSLNKLKDSMRAKQM